MPRSRAAEGYRRLPPAAHSADALPNCHFGRVAQHNLVTAALDECSAVQWCGAPDQVKRSPVMPRLRPQSASLHGTIATSVVVYQRPSSNHVRQGFVIRSRIRKTDPHSLGNAGPPEDFALQTKIN
jgi:hypothetical protein